MHLVALMVVLMVVSKVVSMAQLRADLKALMSVDGTAAAMDLRRVGEMVGLRVLNWVVMMVDSMVVLSV